MLRRYPGFAAVAVLTLALGIGANTAIFSVVNAVLLRPLPFPEPERLVRSAGQDSYPDIQDWRAQSETVESFGGYMGISLDLTVGPELERISGAMVMGDLFQTIGVNPFLGRVLTEEDGRGSGSRVTVISYDLWQRSSGGDREILGQPISLLGTPYSVVGVMPPGFLFPSHDGDVWWPMGEDDPVAGARSAHTFRAFGRASRPSTPTTTPVSATPWFRCSTRLSVRLARHCGCFSARWVWFCSSLARTLRT
jgi:putative ABC transport system permease protein